MNVKSGKDADRSTDAPQRAKSRDTGREAGDTATEQVQRPARAGGKHTCGVFLSEQVSYSENGSWESIPLTGPRTPARLSEESILAKEKKETYRHT